MEREREGEKERERKKIRQMHEHRDHGTYIVVNYWSTIGQGEVITYLHTQQHKYLSLCLKK